jgi:hypothetical protein
VSEKVFRSKTYDKDAREALLKAELDQRSVTRDLGISTKDFEDVLEGIMANKLGKEFDYENLSTQKERLKTLAEKESPEIAQGINDLRKKTPEEGGLEPLFDSIYKKQATVIDTLRDIIKELDKWSTIHEIINDVRIVKDRQVKIKEGTEDAAKGTGKNPPPEEKK